MSYHIHITCLCRGEGGAEGVQSQWLQVETVFQQLGSLLKKDCSVLTTVSVNPLDIFEETLAC